MEIIDLLKEKNSYLKKFYTLNKAEIFRLTEGDFSRLDGFYQARETILDMISHIEALLEEKVGKFSKSSEVSDDQRSRIRAELEFKDGVISQILDQDLQIMTFIEKEKSEIIKELQDVRRNRQVIGAYHSGTEQKRLRTIK